MVVTKGEKTQVNLRQLTTVCSPTEAELREQARKIERDWVWSIARSTGSNKRYSKGLISDKQISVNIKKDRAEHSLSSALTLRELYKFSDLKALILKCVTSFSFFCTLRLLRCITYIRIHFSKLQGISFSKKQR